MNILDVILLPKTYFQKLTEKKAALYAGIFFVGAADLILPGLFTKGLSWLIGEKPPAVLVSNLLFAVVFIAILGAIDVICFSVPLFDLFKLFKKKEGISPDAGLRTRLMKVYISAHFIIVPVNMLLEYAFRNLDSNSSEVLISIAALLSVATIIWFSAVISRGISIIYGFDPILRVVVYGIVFLWSFLLGWALNYAIENWIMKVFA